MIQKGCEDLNFAFTAKMLWSISRAPITTLRSKSLNSLLVILSKRFGSCQGCQHTNGHNRIAARKGGVAIYFALFSLVSIFLPPQCIFLYNVTPGASKVHYKLKK